MKTVSAVVPCYNVEEYLEECLHSVIHQTHQPIEIICIDDCSSDDTLKILERHRKRYPDLITVFQNPINRGASHTRNRGLQAAKGDYIQYLDADDLLLGGKLSHQLEMVGDSSQPLLLAGSYLRRLTNGETVKWPVPDIDPWEALINSELGITSANLWPRKALLQINGWDENLGSSQEYNLLFRLMKNKVKVLFDSECLTIVRERASGSITKKDPAANWKRFLDLRVQILHYVREIGLNKAIENAAMQRICEVIHILYEYDSGTAKELYQEHIRGKYYPHSSSYLTKKLVIAYRLLGFERAELLSFRNIRSVIAGAVNPKSNSNS